MFEIVLLRNVNKKQKVPQISIFQLYIYIRVYESEGFVPARTINTFYKLSSASAREGN